MNDKIFDIIGAELHPREPSQCEGNGKHKQYECCCDECDYYLECYIPKEAQ